MVSVHWWPFAAALLEADIYAAASSRSRNPLNYLSLVENPEIRMPSHRVHAFSHFDLFFDLPQEEQQIKLRLEPNHDILAEGASVDYLDATGTVVRTETIERHQHKVFKGQAWLQEDDEGWIHVGWARIVVRRDGIDPLFEGAFTIMGDHHHVQMRSNYMQTKHDLDPEVEYSEDEYMVMFRDSDISQSLHTELKRSHILDRSCQADQLSFNTNPSHPLFAPVMKRNVGFWGAMPINSLFGKRQIDTNGIPTGGNSGSVNLKSSIGNSAGCPSTRKVALVGIATDCSYTAGFNSTETTRQNVITQINSASDLYEKTFNITLGLQNLTVSDSNCPGTAAAATPWNLGCDSNMTITDRLNTFSQWRGDRNDSNAYWTLLTQCNTGPEVGLAWLGQACVTTAQQVPGSNGSSAEVVSGANVVARTSTEWQVLAHETGHTFGAVHDCDNQTCNDGYSVNAQQCCPLSTSTCNAGAQYIMNPATGNGITQFSACTVGNICSAIGRNSVNTSCLTNNRAIVTISGAQCGNGIVEEGEQCDCGGTEICGNDPCCDPTTCQFINNAVCDDANDDCCQDCQFAANGTVCRASTGVCDPQEVCPGNAAACPADKTAPNGQNCGNSTVHLQCASGQCTSRDMQCKTLMGSYATDNDTYACSSQDCTLSCASPSFGPGTCYSMQQNFLDGTPCGGGGECSNVRTLHHHHLLLLLHRSFVTKAAISGPLVLILLLREIAKAPPLPKRSALGLMTTNPSSSA